MGDKKETRLGFSPPHTSKSNDGKPHVDGQRTTGVSRDGVFSGQKTETVSHNDYPGTQSVSVRKG
jgi:hypothetical protein